MVNQYFNPNEGASTPSEGVSTPSEGASTPSSHQALRQRAEASLRADPRVNIAHADALPTQETSRLIHDLQVHQIELEMQNEELRRAQAELAQAQAHYFDLFDLAPVGYVTLNAQGLLLQVNLTAASLFGVARQAMQMRPISSYILKSDQDIYYLHRTRLLASTEPQTFELRLLKADASVFWAHLTMTTAQGRDGLPVLLLTISDITARHVLEDKVRQMALYDELTQLPNRRLINERLTQIMAISKRSGNFCALMVLDLDNFKAVNDQHGHLVGDLLLVEVARRLTSCVREIDTVGRFGGDEFVVMLGELSASRAMSTAQAAIIAEKIRMHMAEPYLLKVSHDDGSDSLVAHHGSASIGVLVFADNGNVQHDILRWADAAMYQAKDAGGNKVRFHINGKS